MNEFMSFQFFVSSVIASAMIADPTCAPANPPAPPGFAFQSPWTYAGFSVTTVNPVTPCALMSSPLLSLRPRR